MAFSNWDSTYQSFTHRSAKARVRGVPELVGNLICFPATNAAANVDCTMIYSAEAVTTTKKAGTEIDAGDKVRCDPAADAGAINVAAASNTNFNVGFARESKAAAATSIRIKFDGRPVSA